MVFFIRIKCLHHGRFYCTFEQVILPVMKYPFHELIEIPKLQELTDELYRATGIPSSIISKDGEILTGSGWQKICKDFHRKHPVLEKDCIHSDLFLHRRSEAGETFIIYHCPRGLVDACVPIYIDGEHVANIFSGQVFLEAPVNDTELFFREQARKFGLDEEEYLTAFRDVSVFTEEKFRSALSFLSKLALLVSRLGLLRLRQMESDEIFRSIFENNSVATAIINQDTTFSLVNDAFCQMTGFDRDEVIGTSWTGNISAEELEKLKEYNRKRFQGSSDVPDKYEFSFYHKNGEIRYGLMSVATIQSNTRIITSITDITERKKSEIQILKQTELKELNATKDKFFSIIAHDLRSPFNSILGFSELLMENYKEMDATSVEKSVCALHTASKQVFTLLENLLLWARSQTGSLEFRPEVMDIHQLVEDNFRLLADMSKKKNIQMICDIHTPCLVIADKNMIDTVIRNLLSNALKFTPHDGKVSVSAKVLPQYVEVRVTDNGVGIPSCKLDNLFTIECKTNTSGTDNENGSGLGLVICKEFIEKNGGTFHVESVPGKGSAFYFRVPGLE
jgi:PAS domain S-box-containing protein